MRAFVACVCALVLVGDPVVATPTLSVIRDGSAGVRLSWPVGEGAVLEMTDRLGGAWSTATGLEMAFTTNAATVNALDSRLGSSNRYFRLRYPAAVGPVFDIGQPSWVDIFVDATHGNDDFDGKSRSTAFQSVEAAWRSVPSGTLGKAVRIRLTPGTYRGAYLEDRLGTPQNPILIEPADGPGTVLFRPTPRGDAGSLQFLNCSHVYVQDFEIRVEGGDSLHFERCNHVLVRRMRLSSRRTEGQDETLKINQCQHVYIEDSDISDAGDNCIDVVAAQYGHIVRCRIHNSTDWGAYLKGGSAYWLIEANEIYDCGTGGFTAGQGTGFQFMTPPWLHYETYDIKVLNNVVHDTDGAGLGVNGGYNILMAHNTLYRVGARSHLVEFVHGRRGCDGEDVSACQPLLDAGGWGTLGEELPIIPNRNVLFANNLIFNPPGYISGFQHFQVDGALATPPGCNVPGPSLADQGLVIRGNVISNGPADLLLGIEDEEAGCRNADCNENRMRSENRINEFDPQLTNPTAGDFRPVPGGNLARVPGLDLPDFSWMDAPTRPTIPIGNLANQVTRDITGRLRTVGSAPGAYLP